MQYQIWGGYFPGSGYAFAEDLEGLTDEQITRIIRGDRIEGRLPTVKVIALTRGKRPDVFATAWGVRLVGDDMKTVLASFCSEKIQFLPAVIPRSPKVRHHLVNMLSKLACFDRELSDFETLPDDSDIIVTIRKLVLKPIPADAPAGLHLAELPSIWLIRDDLREQMQQVTSSPGTFTKIEDYKRG